MKEAKDRLSELARVVESGERVVVTRHGEPVMELVLPRRHGLNLEALRKWKAERGLPNNVVGELPEDFDAPLPEDFLITPLP